MGNVEETQAKYAYLNLWWMECAKLNLRKIWQPGGRQCANDTRLQEHFYFT
jgi:hypothetical protein